MPSKTKRQATAMRIAAAGKGNLGIPVGVAKDFVVADRGTGQFGKPQSKPGFPPAKAKKFPK